MSNMYNVLHALQWTMPNRFSSILNAFAMCFESIPALGHGFPSPDTPE